MLTLRGQWIRGRPGSPAEPLGPIFRRFQLVVVSSDLADGIYKIAVPLIALTLTRSAFAVSMVGLAVRLPWLVATLPAGVAADRYEPRTVMRWAASARLSLVLVMCVLAALGRLPLPLLALIAFMVGSAGTFVDVGAQTTLPLLVEKKNLTRANTVLQSTQTVLAQLLGPAIGGYAVALGSGLGLSAVVALYIVAVVVLGTLPAARERALLALRERGLPGGERAADADPGRQRISMRSLTRDLGEGLRYLRGRPDLCRLAAGSAVNNLSYSMCLTLLPLRAVAPGLLGLSQTGYGLLLSCLAVGSVAAGMLTRRIVNLAGDRPLMRWGCPLLGLCFMVLAAPSVPAVAAGLFCYGLVSIVWNVVVVSYRQATIPASRFGRVNAAYRWITWGVIPLGSLLAGVLASTVGMTPAFLAAGALPLVTGLVFPAGRGTVPGTSLSAAAPVDGQNPSSPAGPTATAK